MMIVYHKRKLVDGSSLTIDDPELVSKVSGSAILVQLRKVDGKTINGVIFFLFLFVLGLSGVAMSTTNSKDLSKVGYSVKYDDAICKCVTSWPPGW